MTPTVRPWTADDRPAVLALNAELQEYERALRPTRAPAAAMTAAWLAEADARLAGPAADAALFVAVVAGKVVGFLLCAVEADLLEAEPAEVRVRDMVVAAGWRRRGIGRALMDAAHRFAAARAIGRLSVTSLLGNTAARAAYAEFGFADVAITLEMPVRR